MAHLVDASVLAVAPPRAADALRTLDRLIWGLIATTALILAFAPLAGFTVRWSSFVTPLGAAAALVLGAAYYRHRRAEECIASALEGTAQLAVFAAAGAPLSYLAARLALPLWDHEFDAADKALGFDWAGLLEWMNAHRGIHAILHAAYMSFAPQATITICVLAFSGRLAHLRVFLLAFIMTALMTIAISALMPAQGVWLHYGLPADATTIMPVSSTSWPVFLGIRDGSFLSMMAAGSEGIITFPSLHAALGLIFAVALWPLPMLRWFGLALNIAMIAATPIDGSHYLVDVIAGLAMALTCWLIARRTAGNAILG